MSLGGFRRACALSYFLLAPPQRGPAACHAGILAGYLLITVRRFASAARAATTNAAALNRKNVPGSGTAVAAAQKRKSQIGQVAGLARGASDVPSGRLEARGPLLTPKNA